MTLLPAAPAEEREATAMLAGRGVLLPPGRLALLRRTPPALPESLLMALVGREEPLAPSSPGGEKGETALGQTCVSDKEKK